MPARLADIARELRRLGVDVVEPHKGSHWRATRSGESFPVPAHNGLRSEISDRYIQALCRKFGIDYDGFKKLL